MQNFTTFNNLAAQTAQQDPDDPIAFTQAYQDDLFHKSNKITFKGYKIEVAKKNSQGLVSEVKINKDGKDQYRLSN